MTELNTTVHAPVKSVCQLDKQNLYIGTTLADLDPVAADGSYLLPAGCVDTEPPETRDGHAAQWQSDSQTWAYLPDLRGQTAYRTDNGAAETLTEIGALPDHLTLLPPPSEHHTWDGETWTLDPDTAERIAAEQFQAARGSHHLTRKADRATTLSGYGITDGVTPTQLQAAIAGIVSSSPAALDTLRELAAALGNDPNYAATTARKLGEAAPSGTVAWFAGSSAPAGWLKANGAAVSRTTYAALFAAIGTTYGAGDGRTTFNLPDLRGEFVRGWDDARRVDNGRALGSRQAEQMPTHYHGIGDMSAVNDDAGFIVREWNSQNHQAQQVNGESNRANTRSFASGRLGTTNPVGLSGENRPRNIALLGIIKI